MLPWILDAILICNPDAQTDIATSITYKEGYPGNDSSACCAASPPLP